MENTFTSGIKMCSSYVDCTRIGIESRYANELGVIKHGVAVPDAAKSRRYCYYL